ncbi:TetR/AcrR family transcriptional regulator [Nonomuraea diastatica]|uniref:TetR/AcrR family transcriptional regulator n=1 Tax=Nonomuraea diastatica TaxID=1848329 RepID=UPI001C703FB9|nr:TetR/AcrR family transcriptional regulator [Nonomuraea diastatica]
MTLEEISSTALRLIDEGGVEALSMRKLAAELDVNPMSLYHHVASKDALISLICATIQQRVHIPPDDGTPWPDQLGALALAYYRHARTHPAMWTYLHAHPEIIEDRTLIIWSTLYRILRQAGVPEPELRRTSDVLHAFVSGLITAEIQGHVPDDPDETARTLDTAVHLMINGLASYAAR